MDNNWNLVPVEPTPEMLIAGAAIVAVIEGCMIDMWTEDSAVSIYRAMLAAAPTPENNGWRDISTAPRDGTTIWGADSKNGYRGMVHFNGHEWELVDEFTNLPKGVGFYPTNWQPLPQPPALDKGE